MLVVLQNSWHYLIGLTIVGCATALAVTGHISGGDALAVFGGVGGVGFVAGTAQATTTTVTAPTSAVAAPVAPAPSPLVHEAS